MAAVCARGSSCPHDGASWLPWDQVRTRAEAAFSLRAGARRAKESVFAFAAAPTLVAKGSRSGSLGNLVCYYLGIQ